MSTAIGSHLTLYTGVPLDNSYEHTFSNTGLLSNFTHTRVPQNSAENMYYIRPDKNSVRVQHTNMTINEINLYKCNYMTFINNNYEGKLFYCFITDVRYINDYTAEIDFEVDVMMTWLRHTNEDSGCTFEECFVEREHTATDEIGEHILDEPVNIGDYVYSEQSGISIPTGIIVGITGSYDGSHWNESWQTYSEGGLKVYTGLRRYLFDNTGSAIMSLPDFAPQFQTLDSMLTSLWADGKTDWLQFIYAIPLATGINYSFYRGSNIGTNFEYSPRNNKLLCYPYICGEVTNYEGVSSDFAFELNTDNGNHLSFTTQSSITDGSVALIPVSYGKGNLNNIIIKNKFPVYSAYTSEYSTFSARIKSQYPTDLITNIGIPATTGALIGGGAGGGVVGAVVGGAAGLISTVAKTINERNQAQLKGGSPTNTNSGMTEAVTGTLKFGFYKKCIRTEYAKAIDDFFTKFGYKINRLKVPTITISRLNYRYIKTIGCAINGYAPATAMSKIQEIMDNGITFWRTEDVGNYT